MVVGRRKQHGADFNTTLRLLPFVLHKHRMTSPPFTVVITERPIHLVNAEEWHDKDEWMSCESCI